MKKFDSKRFTIVIGACGVLSFMGIWSVLKGMEGLGAAVVVILGQIIVWYLEKESKKPSAKK